MKSVVELIVRVGGKSGCMTGRWVVVAGMRGNGELSAKQSKLESRCMLVQCMCVHAPAVQDIGMMMCVCEKPQHLSDYERKIFF